MKCLATCSPSEFFKQTILLANKIAKWFDVNEIFEIRAKSPKYLAAPETATPEERADIIRKNAEIEKKQALENFLELINNMFDKNEKETLELLGLCCFVEPEHVDDYPMTEYLGCIMDMFEDDNVRRFFSFAAQIKVHR